MASSPEAGAAHEAESHLRRMAEPHPGKFSSATTWEELERAVEAAGGVQGSQNAFSVDDLKRQIDMARKMTEPTPIILNGFTRSEGFRGKVEELIRKNAQGSSES